MNKSTDTLSLADFLLARIAEDEATSLSGQHGKPDRIARECAAKRQIVAEHLDYRGRGQSCVTCEDAGVMVPWPCPTLRALAAVYSDHPDYRRKWRPSVPPIPPPNPHLAATFDGEPPCPL